MATEFERLMANEGVPAVAEFVEETTRYRSFATGAAGTWDTVQARVVELNLTDLSSDEIPYVVDRARGLPPIRYQVAKAAVPEVRVGSDEVEWNGEVYGVKTIESSGAWWLLMCVK